MTDNYRDIGKGNSVLVIDDDRNVRELLKARLTGAGFRVGTAISGEAGARIVHEMYPDLVLLDIHLPGQDGLDVLRHLRNDTHFKHLPIVIISGDSDKATVVRAIQRGATDYIIKPFRVERIILKISTLIRHYRRTQELEENHPGEIHVQRMPDACIFEFVGDINPLTVQNFRKVFTEAFEKQTHNDFFVFDMRFQHGLNNEQLKLVKLMMLSAGNHTVRFLAGRNYAALIDLGLDLETQLFISLEDLEHTLDINLHVSGGLPRSSVAKNP